MFFTLLAFIVALGLLITFHELGHYWVARRCGVKVLRFSVGFGRVLVRRFDRHGTEWALSAIPLGGYVKMLDDPLQADGGDARQAFNRQPVGKRFAIVAAGPLANLLLAAVLYAALSFVGTQEPAAILAGPATGSPAAQAGLHAGDRIVEVNSSPVRSWGEARWELLDALTSGGTVSLEVAGEGGASRRHTLELRAASIEPDDADMMADAGLALATPRPLVREVVAGGAGQEAGLREGDVIVAAGPLNEPSASELVGQIQSQPGQAMAITVLRNGTPVNLQLVPRPETDASGERVGRIGVMLGADFPMVTVRYGPLESVSRGVTRMLDTVWFSLKMMGRMVTGDVSVRNISGPVTIADYAGQTARIGLAAYIGFLALISVSIGVLNLLPIPMLDGGHLMYYIIEMLRGRPLPDAWLETGQRVGLGLLAALMGLAFFNDFSRLFS
ncbi:RIP metalloprotease RseP [Pusillimonas sp.]|uniref:RIP metalloprotease RseP n=1 Tax=Pusillimonas sp. TaxID=3040095 RepID=UPI0029A306C5|nr:RIP metalloprotease RseP [Pusillimonas sp.]MDX3893112.1 RIP metalloprotease RseP [Pusillimonas sp.]